jgi:aerobic-type carbon monoxide dehydrogenase small subunit (CoxS/CutS family)
MASVHLLASGAASSREEIAEGLRGNLCRCTGYSHIIDAVQQAAAEIGAAAAAAGHRAHQSEVAHG